MTDLLARTSPNPLSDALIKQSSGWEVAAHGIFAKHFTERWIQPSEIWTRLQHVFPEHGTIVVYLSDARDAKPAIGQRVEETWSVDTPLHVPTPQLVNVVAEKSIEIETCRVAFSVDGLLGDDFIELTKSPKAEEFYRRQSDCILKRLAIENFKGIGSRQQIDFGPITLLFGPNSAGKSTILHALHYFREIIERRNLDADLTLAGGDHVDLGGFRAFIHGHDANKSLVLAITIESEELMDMAMADGHPEETTELLGLPPPLAIGRFSFGYGINATVELTVTWSAFRATAYVSKYRVFYGDELFAEISSSSDGKQIILNELNLSHPILHTIHSLLSEEEIGAYDVSFGEDDRLFSVAYDAIRDELSSPTERSAKSDGFAPIYVEQQTDALPSWGSTLQLAKSKNDSDATQELIFGNGDPEGPAKRRALSEWTGSLDRLVVGPLRLIKELLKDFRYLGPLRQSPPRIFEPPRFHDTTRWPSGLGAWDQLHNGSSEFVDRVSAWLGNAERLDSGYWLRLMICREIDISSELFRLLSRGMLTDEDADRINEPLSRLPENRQLVIVPIGQMSEDAQVVLCPSDVGIGISQVVPVIVSAVDGHRLLVAIEQPELHLHPRIQARLGDLFIASISEPTRNQVVLETHSEHLILRLQRRIRETTKNSDLGEASLFSEDVVINYLSAENGESRIRRINLDQNGEFVEPWPDDFFEIDFYERFASDR